MDPKIEILCRERDKMRDESIALGQRIHRTIILFFTIAIAIVGLTFQENTLMGIKNLEVIVFSLSQIEFILVILCIVIISNQHVHAGYLQAIETKINAELGSELLIWENLITPRFLAGRKSAFFLGTVCFSLSLAFIFFYMMYLFAFRYGNYIISLILLIELVLSFLLARKQNAEQNNTYRYAIEKINLERRKNNV